MAKHRQPERWESGMLAAVLAVTGTMFLFDKLWPLLRTGFISFNTVMHLAPVFLIAMAVNLIMTEPEPGNGHSPRRSDGRSI